MPFVLTADRMIADERFVRALGHVRLRRGDLELTAGSMTIDRKRNRVLVERLSESSSDPSGAGPSSGEDIRIREGRAVATCGRVELSFPELLGALESATIEVRGSDGRAELTLSAPRIERTAPRELEIDGGFSFTPCDCSRPGESVSATPLWSIGSASADVNLDSGVLLSWPIFYVYDVPVFALPAFYVPIGDRRSGLLAPRVHGGSATGLALHEPAYLVLGRSADLTLEPGFLFSRGLSIETEVRWADEASRVSALRLSVLLDEGLRQGDGWTRARESVLPRFFLSGGAETSVFGGHLGLELGLAGDAAWLSELADGYTTRQVDESLSRASYVIPGRVRVALGLSLVEDLRAFRTPLAPGEELREVPILSARRPGPGDATQRLLELRVDALPYSLTAWPGSTSAISLLGEAKLSVSGFVAPAPGAPRYIRADFRPSLSVPMSLFGVLAIEPGAALRLTGWSGRLERQAKDQSRVGVIVRNVASTELLDGGSERIHRIRFAIDHVISPYVAGGPNPSDCTHVEGTERCKASETFDREDEVDLLAEVHQLALRVETDLLDDRGRRAWYLGAEYTRDFGLSGNRGLGSGPLMVRAASRLSLGSASLGLTGRLGLGLSDASLELLDASAELRLGPKLGIAASISKRTSALPASDRIAPEEVAPSSTLRADYVNPAEFSREVVSGRLDLERWSPGFGATAGLVIKPWPWLGLSASAIFDFDAVPSNPPTGLEDLLGPKVRNVVGSLSLVPPCDCAELGVSIDLARDREGPDFSFFLELARLGEVRG